MNKRKATEDEKYLENKIRVMSKVHGEFRSEVDKFLLEIIDNCHIANYNRLNEKILNFYKTHFEQEPLTETNEGNERCTLQ